MSEPPLPGLGALTPEQVLRLDQLCNRFEAAWKAGRPPCVEEYLAGLSQAERDAIEPELRALEQAYSERMRISLVVTGGPHKGRRFTFAEHDTFLVGRSKHAHFQLPVKDKYFSRIHFLVEVNPPHCRLTDMRSRNGTHVNDQRVQRADLRHDDKIQAGRTVLRVRFHLDDTPAGAGTPAPPPPPPGEVPRPTPAEPKMPAAPATPTPPPRKGPEACPVCATPVGEGGPPGLCAGCRDQARAHPQPIAGYQIVRELGRGGMGAVYLAVRQADGSVFALKTILPNVTASRADVERFLREARILAELSHRNVAQFHEMGESGGRLFFVMEYVPGTDAKRLLKEHGRLTVDRAVGLARQMLEALEFAHGRGFVHRDVKPANLLVTEEEGREVVKLADFGLARVFQASRLSGLTMAGDIGGTMAFMAPEQITNFREARPAADQFSAGATLYNLLTGQYIHDLPERFDDQLLMVLNSPPVPVRTRRPDVPEELARLIHRALAKDPARRFPDVRAMRRALLETCL